ncbi:MAG: glycosyltransferase family 2 protein [Candidatus Woesearchaeota archaeon]|jgi:glycosyltransferase involved in cell wall biosynthesis|nr:glycosyltransferase family 2 protein [Candidatus Woesearchaeota archaeon]MDP6265419.1 glycosyltransferase family 2 protein [Candidatus Woesearchaeota archaeon]HJO02086.1 glycosyltransferase family 2 protein [Candidatus Woesearchaeota archaeon]
MKKKIFAVIPAYNEEKQISGVVKKTKKYVNNVVVVDDGSKDKTKDTAKKSKAIVLQHLVNLGKGAALKTGCDYAVKNKADIIIVIDADAQHNPDDIPKFLENLKNDDIILTYRRLNKNMPFILKFGNLFINKTINFLYGIKIKDSQCGYRAFTAKAYKKLRWKASDYSMESEMIAKIGKYKLSYKEIPIETIYSDKYKGTTILDGIKIIFNLLLWKFNNI